VDGLTPNTVYFYRVYAYNSSGWATANSAVSTHPATIDFLADSLEVEYDFNVDSGTFDMAIMFSVEDLTNYPNIYNVPELQLRSVKYEIRATDAVTGELLATSVGFASSTTPNADSSPYVLSYLSGVGPRFLYK
jgi:hypothetical protein